MEVIHILPPHIAERIAAGEVIERPASVVKELVENSLDAQASQIVVTLEDGGKSFIEILDNGTGISSLDLPKTIQRHATSKIKSLEELENISSLGFRGEALPSVAAAGELQIISRIDGEDANELKVNPHTFQPELEKITFGHFLGSTHGTRVRVLGLFSQIPARLKFLRSPGTEVSYIREWIEKIAYAYPHVSFKLIHKDKTLLHLPVQDQIARVKSLLTDDQDYPVIERAENFLLSDESAVQLKIFWAQGLSLGSTRKLAQVVNKRPLKDRFLQSALLQPFKQALLPGRFPAVIAFLEVAPHTIDVNVHPTKMEIRFLEPHHIFHHIEKLSKQMIQEKGTIAFVPTENSFNKTSEQSQWQSFSSTSSAAQAPLTDSFSNHSAYSQNFKDSSFAKTGSLFDEAKTEIFSTDKIQKFDPGLWVGVIFQTYFLFQKDNDFILIDQHAAHERIRFEKLKKQLLNHHFEKQNLLLPEVIAIDPEKKNEIQQKLSLLDAIGFECEIFSEKSLVFRAIPAVWGDFELKSRLINLLDRLMSFSLKEDSNIDYLDYLKMDEALFEKLAMGACRSAIKAHDRVDPEVAQELVKELFTCDHPWNCPHGRPSIVQISRNKIEEWFQRKI